MTTPTLDQSEALTVSVFEPDIDTSVPSYDPEGNFVDSASDAISSMTLISMAIGGYWQSTMTIMGQLSQIENWLGRLGYHLEVHTAALDKIWEGFVNKVTINVGPLTVTVGPLVDIANYNRLMYSTIDTTTDPPTVGVRAISGLVEDTDSQDRYGFVEKVLSSGGIAVAEITDILTTYTNEHSLPKTTKSFTSTPGRITSPSVTIECLGYVHWFKLYIYNDTTTGTRTIPQKIQDIIGGDPNGLFSTDYSQVDPDGANTQTVRRYNNDYKTAWTQIKALVAHGDGTDRWLFGIYNDRRAYYDIIPSTINYTQRLTDPGQVLLLDGGDIPVRPWEVDVGTWLFFTDFLTGKSEPSNLRTDPRMLFIESMTYTTAWSLTLGGGTTETLPQKLATLGISGIGG